MGDYRYTGRGLGNVVIRGMEIAPPDAGEAVRPPPNIIGLHRTIAYCIVTKATSIDGVELRFLRTEAGFTLADLADLVKKDNETIEGWERGEEAIDRNAEFLIRVLAAERLQLALNLSYEDIARRCTASSEGKAIEIDGSDPKHYRQYREGFGSGGRRVPVGMRAAVTAAFTGAGG